MKTPINIGGNNLVTWLQTATEIRMADLYTITLKNGTVLRYTTWDSNLFVQGNLFLTGPPHIQRSSIEEKLGLDVSSLDLEISASLSDTINGVPVLQLIANGAFDGAGLRIDRLFMDAAGNQIGTVVRFSGLMGAVDEVGRTSAKLTVDALVSLLSQQLPNIILQPNCTNTLFDARCTLAKSNLLKFSEQFDNAVWTSFGAVAAVVTPNTAADPLFGNQTADTLTFGTTGAGQESGIQQDTGIVPVNGSGYTLSVWLMAAAPTSCIIRVVQATGQNDFPLTVNVTSQWQRFTLPHTFTSVGTGTILVRFQLLGNTPGTSVFAWGAKFELGLVATAYESTTSAAAAFTEANTAQAGSTVNKIISQSSRADGYYDNGQILFTSGANSGTVKAVKSYFGQQFFFNSPLPFAPSAGDTFVAYPGCDKTQATCASKFNNLANFEGFPYVPAPETAI